MKITTMFLLAIVVSCWHAEAKGATCTKKEAIQAENSVSMLDDWDGIYKTFKKFRHCDDGAIAEGFSEVVVRMFADRWSDMRAFVQLASSDKDFCVFVRRHIDATVARHDIEKIIKNCNNLCPESALSTCTMIEQVAREALQEFKE
jgi:hypothetical protein